MTTESAFTSTIGVLLAGGAGTRFAGPEHKLLTLLRGRRLFEWGLDAIRSAGLQPWVVWGRLADEAPTVGDDVVVLRNADWRAGMATTIHVAISHARALGCRCIDLRTRRSTVRHGRGMASRLHPSRSDRRRHVRRPPWQSGEARP